MKKKASCVNLVTDAASRMAVSLDTLLIVDMIAWKVLSNRIWVASSSSWRSEKTSRSVAFSSFSGLPSV